MYWLVGAPRVYAANLPELTNDDDDDDAELERSTSSSLDESLSADKHKHVGSDTASGDGGCDDDATPEREKTDPLLDHAPTSTAMDGEKDGAAASSPLPGLAQSGPSLESEAIGGEGKGGRGGENASKGGTASPTIIGVEVARHGHLFATITANSITVWQTRPTAALAAVVRSPQSIGTYGPNVSLLLRPDSAIFVVHTALGYLITYSLATDPDARVYGFAFPRNASGQQHRRISTQRGGAPDDGYPLQTTGGTSPFREVSLRFRMVIKVDAGISAVLALDDELVVATRKPAAVQCIRWTPDSTGNQTSTELLGRMPWLSKKSQVLAMVYDKPMNIFAWVTQDGKAHVVQKKSPAPSTTASSSSSSLDRPAPAPVSSQQKAYFRGYTFHHPGNAIEHATAAAINARFSLIAVGTAGGGVWVYSIRDYAGNVPLSHRVHPPVSPASSGGVSFLAYSPDGYCLFAGLSTGWMSWSVFGKPGAHNFNADRAAAESGEKWLGGVRDGRWIGAGTELVLAAERDERMWVMEFARSALTGCLSGANVSRPVLLAKASLMVYRGYELPDMTSISPEAAIWHTVQVPESYLEEQGPIRSAVMSRDGRYVAVAGRRGLAHYSIHSGRWKTFDKSIEADFLVRGGMCWHQHILIAAVEYGEKYELRLYSREQPLDGVHVLHVEPLSSPVVHLAPSGDDSLLAYTRENVLFHYTIAATENSVELIPVGQIAFHGIIHAPARVRAMSWILPESQLFDGDPSKDVTTASVLFLVDGKLALLQPTTNEDGERKYDMRILAQNVEYFVHLRDLALTQLSSSGHENDIPAIAGEEEPSSEHSQQAHGLRDSLWIFDGMHMCAWPDVQDLLQMSLLEAPRNIPATVQVPVDFYPLSILLNKGIVLGIEPELIQRRDVGFAYFRIAARTQLFLPQVLRHYLSQYNSPAALHLCHHYEHLPYFAHALEILLHNVLDEEVEQQPQPQPSREPSSHELASPPPLQLLPSVVSFLSCFAPFLDIVVQCTRKTEVRSWRTLFAHLPPPDELFEQSLRTGRLKTAGGYLLVLHNLDELGPSSEKLIRLLSRAKELGDWELCKELARFLISLDESGRTLREAAEIIDVMTPRPGRGRRRGFSLGEPDGVEVD